MGLVFLYRDVLCVDLPWMNQIDRPPERKRILVVLTTTEVQHVLALLPGVEGVLARLLYGTGMRLSEGLSLRVKDVDFDRHVVIVRSGKGDKDSVVMLPRSLAPALREQLASSRALWAADRAALRSGDACLTRWMRSTRVPGNDGHDIGCSRHSSSPCTRAPGWSIVTICLKNG
jgi:integrase